MGIFDIFTGAPLKKSAQQTQQFLGNLTRNVGGAINAGTERGIGALQSGLGNAQATLGAALPQARSDILSGGGNALDFLTGYGGSAINALGGGIGQARGDISGGAGSALGYLTGGAGSAIDALRQGQFAGGRALLGGANQAGGLYGQALSQFDPLAGLGSRYGGISSQYEDAIGANGPEGLARAKAAFQTSPGYEFQLGQGLDAINRRRNMGGMLASGNADRDAQEYGQGLAAQEYGNYLNRLNPYVGLEASTLGNVAGNRAGLLQGLGGLYANTGAALGNLFNTGGQNIANVYGGLGSGLAGISTGAGQNLAQLAQAGGTGTANILGNIGSTGTNLYNQQGTQLAQLGLQGALAQAGYDQSTAQAIANLISTGSGQQASLNAATIAPMTQSFTNAAIGQLGGSQNLWNLGLAGLKAVSGLGA